MVGGYKLCHNLHMNVMNLPFLTQARSHLAIFSVSMYRRVPVCSPMIGYKLLITCSAATARYFQPTTALCFFLHKSMELSRNDDRLWVRGAREIPLAARENIFPSIFWFNLRKAPCGGTCLKHKPKDLSPLLSLAYRFRFRYGWRQPHGGSRARGCGGCVTSFLL